jgi:hypothetical protein
MTKTSTTTPSDEPDEALLDALPLELLLALQEAMADPSESGRERAALRALDRGFHLQCTSAAPAHPLPMEEAPEGVAVDATLRFSDDA